MRILGIIVPSSDRHGASFVSLPLGMMCVAGTIRKRFPEADLRLLDLSFDAPVPEGKALARLRRERPFKPDYVLFGGMITRYGFVKTLSRLCREVFPDAVQVCGGTIAWTGYKPLSRNSSIDVFVVGEGEDTVVELLEKGSPDGVRGVFVNRPYGTVTGSAERKRVGDLDRLARPAYDLVDVERYVRVNLRNTGWRTLPLVVSRGCPFSCNFCFLNFGREMTYRSPGSVVEELEFLKGRFRIDSFTLWDDIQFVNKAWVREFAETLLRERLGLKWSCVSRVTLFPKGSRRQDLDLLRTCRSTGLMRISLGIESGNQRMLDAMNKRITVDQIEYCVRLVREAGIKATGSMLVGYPGENRRTIQDSVDFARRNLLATSFYRLIVLPGTPLYEKARADGLIGDEDAFLDRISRRGDASDLSVNLTDMSDDEYARAVREADRMVSSWGLPQAVRYWGPRKGAREYLRFGLGRLKGSFLRRKFETP